MRNSRAVRLLALAGTLAWLQASPLPAQDTPQQQAPQPGQERERGRNERPRNPEREAQREAERQALLKTCSADIQKFCGQQEGRGVFQCLREKRAELEPACGTELDKRRGGRRRGGERREGGERPEAPPQPQ